MQPCSLHFLLTLDLWVRLIILACLIIDRERLALITFHEILLFVLFQAHANVSDLGKKLKGADGLGGEMSKRVEELTIELTSVHGENQKLIADLARLKAYLKELEEKNDGLGRENKQLSGMSSILIILI